MKLFHIINNISVENYAGGAELFSIRLLEFLPKEFERHLIVIWQCGTEDEKEIVVRLKEKISIHFLGDYFNKKKTFSKAVRSYFKLLEDLEPSIIHSHSELPDVFGILTKIFYNKKTTFIRTMHTDKQWQKSLLFELIFLKILLPLYCDKEVAISEMTKERLDNRCVAKRLNKLSKKIYNAIDEDSLLKKYEPKDNILSLDILGKRIRAISTGRLTEQKGYRYLIEAISILHKEIDIYLYIFGEGDQRKELEELIKKNNLQDNVKLLGHNKNACMFYKDFDVFVSSSIYEGFPTVILEAMVLNIPVIATNVSGSRELIINKKTGLLIPPKNPVELSNSIKYLMSNYDKALEYASNAKKLVSQYRIENIVREYLNIYKDSNFT